MPIVNEGPPLKLMAGAAVTLIVAVASLIPVRSARSVVLPMPTPVTGTSAEVAFAFTVAVEGTVAMVGSSVLRVKVYPPLGAGAERFSVMLLAFVCGTEKGFGEKLAVSVTVIVDISGAKVLDIAVT